MVWVVGGHLFSLKTLLYLGFDLHVVSVNGDDAHRGQVNGCAGKTAEIAWIPDWLL